eukprot:7053744-Alexandrium_andersonii.AAC.1
MPLPTGKDGKTRIMPLRKRPASEALGEASEEGAGVVGEAVGGGKSSGKSILKKPASSEKNGASKQTT